MNIKKLHKCISGTFAFSFLALGMGSCSLINEDLEPCKFSYRIKFDYSYNMKFANAAPAMLNSVNVWAFDQTGKLAWKEEAAGDVLKSENFYLDVDVPEGVYDFLVWGDLSPDSPFKVANAANPSDIESLGCELQLKKEDKEGVESLYSNYELRGLYHGMLEDVEISPEKTVNNVLTVTVPLMKDTKEINVLLQHLDGTPIARNDFAISIKAANSLLGWNNDVLEGPEFSYRPWSVSYGEASTGTTREQSTVTTLMAEIGTSRIMAGSNQVLSVVRLTDNVEIIRIPLVQYLLLVKGNYHRDLTDQEYLDRQDEYSLMFFLTEDNNWYTAGGIYINNWAVVPPQEGDM